MIPEDLLNDIFSEVVNSYGAKLDIKSKRRFNIYILDDVPHDLKQDIKLRIEALVKCIGRSKYELDHPLIFKKGELTLIKSGIWSIRIL